MTITSQFMLDQTSALIKMFEDIGDEVKTFEIKTEDLLSKDFQSR